MASGSPASHSASTIETANFEYAPYLTTQSLSTPVSLSSAISPFADYSEFPSPYQQQQQSLTEFPDPQASQRVFGSAGSLSVPPDLLHDFSASGSYASSESCNSPFSEAVTSPAMTVSGTHAYSPGYSSLRGLSASATSDVAANYHNFQDHYGGSSLRGSVSDTSVTGDIYPNMNSAGPLYDASTVGIASPSVLHTVSNFASSSPSVSVIGESQRWLKIC